MEQMEAEDIIQLLKKTNNNIAPENTTSNDSLFKRLLGN